MLLCEVKLKTCGSLVGSLSICYHFVSEYSITESFNGGITFKQSIMQIDFLVGRKFCCRNITQSKQKIHFTLSRA